MAIHEEITKRYYSIGEVADQFGVSASLIRFWEGEFDNIKPHKNGKGERRFTPQSIEQIRLIYHLVKERGFTLQGAKQELAKQKEWDEKRQAALHTLHSIRQLLEELREAGSAHP